ncbi:MAG: response regulator [Pseudonocardia sp.]
MSRILYVDDDPFWTNILRKALRDHDVNVAASLQEALDSLQLARSNPYDLALVDLNLISNSDQLGGEILDAIRSRYPSTRRVVITGSPPSGSVRRNILDRYGVQEIILKAQGYLPDLRRVVEDALSLDPDDVPTDVQRLRSDLRDRLYVKRRDAIEQADARIGAVGHYAHNAAKLHDESGRRAREELDRATRWRDRIIAKCAELDRAVDEARSAGEATTLAERLDSLEAELNDERDS